MRCLSLGVLALALSATGAVAKPFDPTAHRVFAGPPSEILVLGTPHLSQLGRPISAAQLTPLLDRLARWKPDLITVESVSGPQCEYLRRYAPLHADAAKSYCWDPAPAQKATGLDVAAATLTVQKVLSAWPAEPTAVDRRRLAATFLAGGERTSALVQWLRLPMAERHAGDGIDAGLAALLDKASVAPQENYLIAAALAARLGLERVYATDDHTADGPFGDDPAYGKAVERAWDNPAAKARRNADEALTARVEQPGGLLALYRSYNAPAAADAVFASDFGAALRDSSPEHFGRRYAAWWETRNLRMVANIRSVLIDRPGARLLTIVGASHKGYFEAYLRQMHDLKLADTDAVLR